MWSGLKHSRRALCTVRLAERVMSVRSFSRVLCCTPLLTDFFMHICCMAQDTEHPILSALSHGTKSRHTGHRELRVSRNRTNTSSLISCIAGTDNHYQWWRSLCSCGTSSRKSSRICGGQRMKSLLTHGGRRQIGGATPGSGWWTTGESGTERCWSNDP